MHFSIRIIKIYRFLCQEKQEYILSKQLLRSGTSIGANLAESECAISKKDFAAKIYIALNVLKRLTGWIFSTRQIICQKNSIFLCTGIALNCKRY